MHNLPQTLHHSDSVSNLKAALKPTPIQSLPGQKFGLKVFTDQDMLGLLFYILYIVFCDTILSYPAWCGAQEPQRALFCCILYKHLYINL